MDRFHAVRRRFAAVTALVLSLTVVLVACGSGSGESADADEAALRAQPEGATGDLDAVDDTSPERAADEGGGEGGPGGRGGDGQPLFQIVEERVVKTGEMTLEVENVGVALARVRAIVTELDGYVGGSQAGTLDERATLTVRVPAPAFDTMLARLHELDAELIAEATREEVVTSQVVDLGARIENLRASEASYRELLGRAERIDDILAVQSRLDDVRGQIEQLQAQLDALEDRAALSTLTITLLPRAEPVTEQAETWNPGAQLDRALASLVAIGQGLLDAAIWFVVVWLPILLVLVLLVLVALRGVLEVRRRLPGTDATPAGAADDGAA